MKKAKVNIQELVEELAESFVNDEVANMISVSSKLKQRPASFIESNYPGGIYSFLTVNGDVSVRYLKDHMDSDLFRKLTNKHYDSFIKMVDVGVNKQFRWYLEERSAA